jgi:hypothetical protein
MQECCMCKMVKLFNSFFIIYLYFHSNGNFYLVKKKKMEIFINICAYMDERISLKNSVKFLNSSKSEYIAKENCFG